MIGGKLSTGVLRDRVLPHLGARRSDVLIHAEVGEDATAVRFGDEACVLSSDPITGAGEDAGWFAVHIAVNDVAASGAEPVGVLLTLLLPPGTGELEIQQIMQQAEAAARELNIEIMGGHSEITAAVNQVIISTTAVGRVAVAGLKRTGGARPGDYLFLAGTAGLEGTAILAGDHGARLTELVGASILSRARDMAREISVVRVALAAARHGATALHDVTEGGVLGAVHEMADAARAGVVVWEDRIPVAAETAAICRALSADPLRLVGSGALLATAPDPGLMTPLATAGKQVAVIGRILPEAEGRWLEWDGDRKPLEPPAGDELWRLHRLLSD